MENLGHETCIVVILEGVKWVRKSRFQLFLFTLDV